MKELEEYFKECEKILQKPPSEKIKYNYTQRMIKICKRLGFKGQINLSKTKRNDLYRALGKKEAYICGITVKWVD